MSTLCTTGAPGSVIVRGVLLVHMPFCRICSTDISSTIRSLEPLDTSFLLLMKYSNRKQNLTTHREVFCLLQSTVYRLFVSKALRKALRTAKPRILHVKKRCSSFLLKFNRLNPFMTTKLLITATFIVRAGVGLGGVGPLRSPSFLSWIGVIALSCTSVKVRTGTFAHSATS